MQNLVKYLLAACFLVTGINIHALADEAHDEHSMVLSLGPVSERSLTDKKTTYGSSAALEFTAIEKQLEIEVGRSI